ncbi:hypothetical protein AAG747_22325 [Rapidithrix thailandica]|uniref:Lipoprotein n=1 Tax=Rapidithrix thailandica TaxID=413964 RepID=A0AAW9S9V1_9BACT
MVRRYFFILAILLSLQSCQEKTDTKQTLSKPIERDSSTSEKTLVETLDQEGFAVPPGYLSIRQQIYYADSLRTLSNPQGKPLYFHTSQRAKGNTFASARLHALTKAKSDLGKQVLQAFPKSTLSDSPIQLVAPEIVVLLYKPNTQSNNTEVYLEMICLRSRHIQ